MSATMGVLSPDLRLPYGEALALGRTKANAAGCLFSVEKAVSST